MRVVMAGGSCFQNTLDRDPSPLLSYYIERKGRAIKTKT